MLWYSDCAIMLARSMDSVGVRFWDFREVLTLRLLPYLRPKRLAHKTCLQLQCLRPFLPVRALNMPNPFQGPSASIFLQFPLKRDLRRIVRCWILLLDGRIHRPLLKKIFSRAFAG